MATRPDYIADPERPCYCGESCEETGARWQRGVLCSVCAAHAKHEHCDREQHCLDANGLCACHACVWCGEFVEEGDRYCSDACQDNDDAHCNGPRDTADYGTGPTHVPGLANGRP